MANRLCGNNVNVPSGHFSASGVLPTTTCLPTQPTQSTPTTFTNTAKLPIDTVKRLIAAVAARPNLWIRNHNGHRRGEINLLWHEVSKEVHLPVDICRIKWGHLRDNFRKVFIRNKLSGETPTTWRFYNDMCFMEGAVAENVLRQNRYKDVSRLLIDEEPIYEPSKELYAHPSVPICELRETFERDAQQYNFTYGFPEFFNESQRQHKRIKLESQGFDMPFGNHLQSEVQHEKHSDQMSYSYSQTDPDPDQDDDDEFDEDAATEDDQETEIIEKPPNGDVFTIEVFDDDDDEDVERKDSSHSQSRSDTEDMDSKRNPQSGPDIEESDSKVSLSCKSIVAESAIYTTAGCKKVQEQDADRMFLLSLLPYLKNIDEKRKLHVRQKLQSVLIDELG